MSFEQRLLNLLNSLNLPESIRGVLTAKIVLMVVSLIIIIGFISVSVLFLIWLERKISARIQRRMGPMTALPPGLTFLRSGSMWFGGLLQTVADAIKLLCKEDVTPGAVDRVVFFLAPCIVFTASLLAYIVIPFGPDASVSDLNVGVLYLLAVSSITVLGIMMAGWGSNSKYSLLGGLRSVAQMIAYEIPMIFAVLGPVLLAGSLSLQQIVAAQEHSIWYGLWPCPFGLIIFIIAGTAETNRPPFDLPEGESELVAGFVTEYSGMKFAMFFLAEFSNMFVISAIAAAIFLGGWTLPFGISASLQHSLPHLAYSIVGAIIFMIKTYFIILILMWIRWTFPRIRVDQLMNFGWKTLLPFSFLQLIIAAVWVVITTPRPGP